MSATAHVRTCTLTARCRCSSIPREMPQQRCQYHAVKQHVTRERHAVPSEGHGWIRRQSPANQPFTPMQQAIGHGSALFAMLFGSVHSRKRPSPNGFHNVSDTVLNKNSFAQLVQKSALFHSPPVLWQSGGPLGWGPRLHGSPELALPRGAPQRGSAAV